MKYDMIIFDIDGTLFDAVDVTYECIKEAIKQNNIECELTKNTVISGMGKGFSDFAFHCMPSLDKKLREKIIIDSDNIKFEHLIHGEFTIYDNVYDILKALSLEYKIGIISNCGKKYLEIAIEKIGIKDYITDSIAASYLNITKAEAIKKMKKDNDIKKAIYVGDTLGDYNSTIEAESDFIFASYGFGKVESKYKINNFNELPVIIKQIEEDNTRTVY